MAMALPVATTDSVADFAHILFSAVFRTGGNFRLIYRKIRLIACFILKSHARLTPVSDIFTLIRRVNCDWVYSYRKKSPHKKYAAVSGISCRHRGRSI